jgi:hypothetical protein
VLLEAEEIQGVELLRSFSTFWRGKSSRARQVLPKDLRRVPYDAVRLEIVDVGGLRYSLWQLMDEIRLIRPNEVGAAESDKSRRPLLS